MNIVAKELIFFANNQLTITEKSLLQNLIDYLLNAVNNGNSCIFIEDFCNINPELALNAVTIIRLLEKSKICNFTDIFQIKQLHPLSIFILNKKYQLLYLTRYLYYEISISKYLNILNQRSVFIDKNLSAFITQMHSQNSKNFPNHEQLNAIITACNNKLSFITGGPGTGKTTTILLLLITLLRLDTLNINSQIKNISIIAPTGKATNKVKQSLNENLKKLINTYNLSSNEISILNSIEYSTIHAILGFQLHNIHFKHNSSNPINTDILIIDESSMIGLPLFYKLIRAINPQKIKHIIFLGDVHQLSSVEEGYVFASIVQYNKQKNLNLLHPHFNICELKIGNRNSSYINDFATAILNKDVAKIQQILQLKATINLYTYNFKEILHDLLRPTSFITKYIQFLQQINITKAIIENFAIIFTEFKKFVILCAINISDFGVININNVLDTVIRVKLETNNLWYTGRPILIIQNNPSLNLYNGDIGICIIINNKPQIIFENGKIFIPEALPKFQIGYAITIHKSQGSEYDNIYIVIPTLQTTNNNISNELLYTAVTRAKHTVTIYAEEKTLIKCIQNNSNRISGISTFLQHTY